MGVLRAVKVVYRARFESDRPYEREFGGIRRYEPISRTGEGLVQVLHVGRNPAAGCFYCVMELADDADDGIAAADQPGDGGARERVRDAATYLPRTLRSDLERLRRLPVEECLEIGRSLATGLAQLHRHRLVHRDLKPGNVIFVHGRAKLADAGLVTGTDECGSFVGTEGFVPPEGPGRVPADLFSLSRVLYQAATGLNPDRFPEIPTDWIGAPNATGLIEFHEILLKLGEGNVARRYQDAADVLADLALLQSGQSVRQLRALERRVVWFRRFGFAALTGLLLAALAWLWASREARRERDNLARVSAAEQQARHELINVQLARARAERLAGGLGRRDAGLQALTNAVPLRPDIAQLRDLRSEAAVTLAQPGLRWVPAPAGLGHLDPMSVACDADQEIAATWTDDGAIVVRRLDTGEEIARLPAGRPAPDEVVGFNASNTFLAVRRDNELVIGDLARGAYVRTNRLATFAPQDRLWTVGADGALLCERLPSGEIVRELPGDARLAPCLPWQRLAVSENGWLAAAGADRRIVCWSEADPVPALILNAPEEVYSLAWNTAGNRLAVGTSGGEVLVWHLPDPTVQWRKRIHTAAVRRLSFSGDDRVLSTASEGEVLRLLDAHSGKLLADLPAIVWNQAFRSSDNRLALVWRGGEPGFIEMIRPIGLELRRGSRDSANDGALSFSPDGRWLAVGTVATVDVWDQARGTLAFSHESRGIRAVAFQREPPELWWLDDDGAARVALDPDAERELPRRDRSRPWSHLSLAPDGTLVLADASGESLSVRPPGRPEVRLGPHPFVRFTAVTTDGAFVASGSLAQSGLQLWNVASATRLTGLPTGLNVRPAFSPDGRWLAVAGPTCTLWRGPEWSASPTPLSGPANTVAGAAAFSPDSRTLAVVYGDHEVRLFHLPDASPGLTLEAPGGARVLAVAFSPDGRLLAACTAEGEVLLWNLPELEGALIRLGLRE